MVASEGRQKDWAINPHFRKTCQSPGFMAWIECWPAPKQLAVEQRRGGRRLIGELSFYDLATKYSSLSPEHTHTSQQVHTSTNRLKTQWVTSSQRAHTYQVPTQWVHNTRNRLEIHNDSLISSSVCWLAVVEVNPFMKVWENMHFPWRSHREYSFYFLSGYKRWCRAKALSHLARSSCNWVISPPLW